MQTERSPRACSLGLRTGCRQAAKQGSKRHEHLESREAAKMRMEFGFPQIVDRFSKRHEHLEHVVRKSREAAEMRMLFWIHANTLEVNMNLHEECGIFGIWSPEKASLAGEVFAGLHALQHRGQEAAGIAINEDRIIRCHKDVGLVSEVFDGRTLAEMGEGNIAVGHVRYSTSGNNNRLNAQPMLVRHVKGQLALCHNGNLTNSYELRRELELSGCIFQTTSDTEVISYLITRARLIKPSIEEAVLMASSRLEGAFSLIMMSPAKLIAARDPHGVRPLCQGRCEDGSIVFASETCALFAVGATWERDLLPGEIVVVEDGRMRSIFMNTQCKKPALCVFEYIYFARPDSVIDGLCVHEARKTAGAFLAESAPVEADIVMGVPDSGLDAALGFAQKSGIPYNPGLVKNKYVGRSFIAPDQGMRRLLVRQKLSVIESVVRGKRIVLIDDSIVRGTTSSYIVGLLRDAGAAEVHMRISAPPFLHPCYYGTDVDSEGSLIAQGHTPEQIAEMIGADSVAFLTVEQAIALAGGRGVCTACFDGEYPAGTPKKAEKDRFEISGK